MAIYLVSIPIAGVVSVEVEACGSDDAIEKAMSVQWDLASLDNGSGEMQLNELDLYEKTHEGNCCYLPLWEIEVEEN